MCSDYTTPERTEILSVVKERLNIKMKELVYVTKKLSSHDIVPVWFFGDEYVYAGRFRVTGAARIVPGVRVLGPPNGQPRLAFGAGLRLHSYAPPGRVVVDHPIVVIPEHVLRRLRTLRKRE
jgi:hypothetical protein